MASPLALTERLVRFAYWYCTDFMVNLAACWHISYNEANTRTLLILIPGLFALLVAARLGQWLHLWRLRRRLTQLPS